MPVLPISPKAVAGSVGVIISTLLWLLAVATFWEGTFTDVQLVLLVGATATIVSFALSWAARDELRDMGETVLEARARIRRDPGDPGHGVDS